MATSTCGSMALPLRASVMCFSTSIGVVPTTRMRPTNGIRIVPSRATTCGGTVAELAPVEAVLPETEENRPPAAASQTMICRLSPTPITCEGAGSPVPNLLMKLSRELEPSTSMVRGVRSTSTYSPILASAGAAACVLTSEASGPSDGRAEHDASPSATVPTPTARTDRFLLCPAFKRNMRYPSPEL